MEMSETGRRKAEKVSSIDGFIPINEETAELVPEMERGELLCPYCIDYTDTDIDSLNGHTLSAHSENINTDVTAEYVKDYSKLMGIQKASNISSERQEASDTGLFSRVRSVISGVLGD